MSRLGKCVHALATKRVLPACTIHRRPAREDECGRYTAEVGSTLGCWAGCLPHRTTRSALCSCELCIPPTLRKYTRDRPALCLPALEYSQALTQAFAHGSCAMRPWGRQAVLVTCGETKQGMLRLRFAVFARLRTSPLAQRAAGLLRVAASKRDNL